MANIENLTKLRDWLLDGAPHIVLDMNVGVSDWENVVDEVAEYQDNGLTVDEYKSVILRDQPGKGDCGTICCIAGAASLMSLTPDGSFPPMPVQEENMYNNWFMTRNMAMKWLDVHDNDDWYGNELFSSELAPENCTPAQAAQAVQNVIDGLPAWQGIE